MRKQTQFRCSLRRKSTEMFRGANKFNSNAVCEGNPQKRCNAQTDAIHNAVFDRNPQECFNAQTDSIPNAVFDRHPQECFNAPINLKPMQSSAEIHSNFPQCENKLKSTEVFSVNPHGCFDAKTIEAECSLHRKSARMVRVKRDYNPMQYSKEIRSNVSQSK